MILSFDLSTQVVRVVRALALPCAAGLLSVGIVHAQDASRERPAPTKQDPSAQALRERIASGELTVEAARLLYDQVTPPGWALLRYAAGAEEIDAQVAAGKLSPEDAAVKKLEIGRALQSIAFSMEVLGKSLEEARVALAVESGKMSPEEAAALIAKLEREAAAAQERIKQVLVERGGLNDEQVGGVLRVLDRVVEEVRREGNAFELDPELRVLLANRLRLTDEQIDLVVRVAQRFAAQGRAESNETPDWVARVLAERGGLTDEQVGGVQRALQRIVAEIEREGEAFELGERMRVFLVQELRLTNEQIELVVGVARRVVGSKSGRGR